MKRVFLKAGLMMLAMGLLMACSSGNDIEPTPEEPKQELPEEPDPKDDPEAQDPEDPDSEIEFEDSMVVDMLPPTRAIELTQEQRAFVKKNNDFTFNFYRTLHTSQQEKKSNITSPLSVTYVMGMLNDGATGKTSEEITNVLGFGDGDKTTLNAYCQALIKQAPLADPNVTLEMADIVAADDDVVFEERYKKDMQDYYEAEVTSLDFADPATLDYLNGWCNEKSHGMIPKIIDELSPEALLVLMNAIYFKASWTEKFDENDTKEETFTKAAARILVYDVHRYLKESYDALLSNKRAFREMDKTEISKAFSTALFELNQICEEYDIILPDFIDNEVLRETISDDMAKIVNEVL